MGDRCYVHGLVKRADWELFKVAADLEDWHLRGDDDMDNAVAFEIEEANYGFEAEGRAAATARLTFVAYNTNGDSYGAGGAFSVGDGVLHIVPVDAEEAIFVSFRQGSPEVDPEQMARAVAAWHAVTACYRIFGEAPAAQED